MVPTTEQKRWRCETKNKLSVPEMTNETFAISHLGLSRVKHCSPIQNALQIAILDVGCATDKFVIDEKEDIIAKPYIGLPLIFDHRAVNGAPAAEFLSD